MLPPTDDKTIPPVAAGHIRMNVPDVEDATDWFGGLGLREITRQDTFSVMELKGGTHLVLIASTDPVEKDAVAPIDLMVDDVAEWHAKSSDAGLNPSELTSGSVHSSFYLPGPGGWRVKITSSHAGNRAV